MSSDSRVNVHLKVFNDRKMLQPDSPMTTIFLMLYNFDLKNSTDVTSQVLGRVSGSDRSVASRPGGISYAFLDVRT